MRDPLGVSPSEGNQGTTWGKETLLTSVGIKPMTSGLDRSSITMPTELPGWTEQVGDDYECCATRHNIHMLFTYFGYM